jgi:hypothetical protein
MKTSIRKITVLWISAFCLLTSTFLQAADTTIDGNLTVNSNAFFGSNVTVSGTLTVTNSTALIGGLTLTGPATLNSNVTMNGSLSITNVTVTGKIVGGSSSSFVSNFGSVYFGESGGGAARLYLDSETNLTLAAAVGASPNYVPFRMVKPGGYPYVQLDIRPGSNYPRVMGVASNIADRMVIESDRKMSFWAIDQKWEWGYPEYVDLTLDTTAGTNRFRSGTVMEMYNTGFYDTFIVHNTNAFNQIIGDLFKVRRNARDFFIINSNGVVSVRGHNPRLTLGNEDVMGGGDASIFFYDWPGTGKGVMGFRSNSTDFVFRSGANSFTNGIESLRIKSDGTVVVSNDFVAYGTNITLPNQLALSSNSVLTKKLGDSLYAAYGTTGGDVSTTNSNTFGVNKTNTFLGVLVSSNIMVNGPLGATNITLSGKLIGGSSSSFISNFGSVYFSESIGGVAKLSLDSGTNLVLSAAVGASPNYVPFRVTKPGGPPYIQMDIRPGSNYPRLLGIPPDDSNQRMVVESTERLKFDSDVQIFEWGYDGWTGLSFTQTNQNQFVTSQSIEIVKTSGSEALIINNTNALGNGVFSLGNLFTTKRAGVEYFTITSNGLVTVHGPNPSIELGPDYYTGGGNASLLFTDWPNLKKGLMGFASNSTDFVFRSGASTFTNGSESFRIKSDGTVVVSNTFVAYGTNITLPNQQVLSSSSVLTKGLADALYSGGGGGSGNVSTTNSNTFAAGSTNIFLGILTTSNVTVNGVSGLVGNGANAITNFNTIFLKEAKLNVDANTNFVFSIGSERFRITKDGFVGIGTNNPSAQLHVNGTAQFDSTVRIVPSGDIAMGAYTNN